MNIEDIQHSKVLIVDDNPENLNVLCEYLRLCGFTIFLAESGERALEMVDKCQPDIIILDVLMPGIDGFEVCRRLKKYEKTKNTPVLFVSALSETVDKVKGFDAGGVDYITKPFQHEEVVARIAAHLRLRKLQKDLQDKQQYTRNIIESSLNMIITVDTERRIVEFNKAAEEAFGYRREEVAGKNVNILYADPEEYSLIHETMLKEQRSIQEVSNKRKNGEVFPCLISASTLYDTHAKIIGYMGISRDITELKQTQDELLKAHNELQEKNEQLREINASKDKFFSIISHDLRGSFGTVLGFAQLITENIEGYDKKKLKNFVTKLRISAERLYALLENLLTWSKLQRGVMESSAGHIKLSKIANDNLEFFMPDAEQKQITLRNLMPEETWAYADYSMVDTVVRNLISNALKFTSTEGSITLSAADHDRHYLAISVSDTGVGITEEVIPQLLRLDTQCTHTGTAGEQGSGLGLILCKELVEKNSGKLWVESEIGKGTTFTFTLPKQAPE